VRKGKTVTEALDAPGASAPAGGSNAAVLERPAVRAAAPAAAVAAPAAVAAAAAVDTNLPELAQFVMRMLREKAVNGALTDHHYVELMKVLVA